MSNPGKIASGIAWTNTFTMPHTYVWRRLLNSLKLTRLAVIAGAIFSNNAGASSVEEDSSRLA